VEHEVIATTAPRRPTAILAATTTWPEYPALWRQLLDEVHANVQRGGSGHKGRNVMLYLDDTPRVEVGVELDQPVTLTGRLIRSTLPEGPVAMTVHRGDYALLGAAHEAVISWCAEQGLTRTGVRWEIYGHWYEDAPERVETEIYWQLTGTP
jgi:effector-binding domain-containing protein